MVALVTKASKGQNRNLDITGFVKETGTKVAKCVNDLGKKYFVEVRADGTTSCYKWAISKRTGLIVKDECLGQKHTGHCYHVDAVKATDLPTYEEVTQTPDEIAAAAEERNMVKLAAYRKNTAPDTYEQIAQVTKCPTCHKVDEYYNKTGKCYWEPTYSQL